MCNVGLCAVPCFMVYHTQIQILSYSIPKDPCQPLVTTLHPHLIQNSIFTCDKHKDKICKVIIQLVMKPILNICL
jgi:hypothetical protein